MKVAILTNFIPPYRKSLFNELNQKIDGLTIFISQEMEKNRNWQVDHGQLPVIVQKGFRYTKKWKGKYGYNEKTVVQIPLDTFFKLRKNNPEVVISSELGMRSLLAAFYCKLYKKPLILWLALSEHTEKNKTGMRVYLRKKILNAASAIICNGKSANRYIKSLGVIKKTFYAPYSTDYKIIENTAPSSNKVKTILFSGQLIKRKGIHEMCKALVSWAKDNTTKQICLVVAGDGPEKHEFEAVKAFENIDLKLLGNVSYENMQAHYLSSDIYLFPTLADEWGVVVNEAMACGIPIIGSKYSQAVEELVHTGKNGWIIQPDHHPNFLQVLSIAIDTPIATLQKMGNNGKELIKNYTAEIIAANFINAIKFTLKK